MKIKTPNEVVFINGLALRDILNSVCNVRKGTLRVFFQENRELFLDDNDRFFLALSVNRSYNSSTVNYSLVKSSLINLYSASDDDNDRAFIKEFRRSQRTAQCPYCMRTTCRTLDHYYDKDSYPELSLNLWNLVPSCGDCNYKKLNEKNVSTTERFLHPFFDEFYQDIETYHLKLSLETTHNTTYVTFNLVAGLSLSGEQRNVVNWHIDKMDINGFQSITFRDDLLYWVNKARSKVTAGDEYNSVRDYLLDELQFENSFQWRAVVLNSLVSDRENFDIVLNIIRGENYAI